MTGSLPKCNRALLEFLSGIETLQANVQRIWASLERQPFPGCHLDIGADASPRLFRVSLALEKRHYLVVVHLGADLAPHFDWQGYVLTCAKACIQPKLRFNRGQVRLIVALETGQTLLSSLHQLHLFLLLLSLVGHLS
jgi:hypothetical protein